jgi:DNA-binding CsgD family transcriptional regulator
MILVTRDAAAGEAIAFACARRGIEVSVNNCDRSGVGADQVVLLDCQTADATAVQGRSSHSDGGTPRMVAIGQTPDSVAAVAPDVWLSLGASIDELVAAINGSARSHPVHLPAAPNPLDLLTAREREVMRLLLAGLGVKAIGTQLKIASSTARTHLQNILAKLDVSSRAEAAAWALRAGLEPADVDAEAAR